MAQTCSGEEVGREDTREKEEEEADVMRCGVVWCGVVWCGVQEMEGVVYSKDSFFFPLFSCREIFKSWFSLYVSCVCSIL